jgi:hypothetical protein
MVSLISVPDFPSLISQGQEPENPQRSARYAFTPRRVRAEVAAGGGERCAKQRSRVGRGFSRPARTSYIARHSKYTVQGTRVSGDVPPGSCTT